MATSPDALGPDRRITPARALLIGAGVLLLLFFVWFAFLRADEEVTDTAAPVPAPAATPDAEPTVRPAKKNGPVETFEVFAPKDPFDPLISAAAAGGGTPTGTAGATAGGGTGAGTMTETGASGTTTTTGANGTTTTTTTSGGGRDAQDVQGRRVRLIDVFAARGGRRAQVQVDGTVYTVDEGERFAENFRLLSTSGRCATMLYGDDEFTLCEGEEILK